MKRGFAALNSPLANKPSIFGRLHDKTPCNPRGGAVKGEWNQNGTRMNADEQD